MRSDKLIVGPANLLVKFDIRPAAQTTPLSRDCGMKNAADEKRVIADVRPEQERLLRSRATQRDEHVGNVLLSEIVGLIGDLQPARARKCFKQRPDIITKLAVADSALLQNVPGENVKVKLRRYPQMSAVIQDRVHQSWMIEDGITRFDIAQKIDQ